MSPELNQGHWRWVNPHPWLLCLSVRLFPVSSHVSSSWSYLSEKENFSHRLSTAFTLQELVLTLWNFMIHWTVQPLWIKKLERFCFILCFCMFICLCLNPDLFIFSFSSSDVMMRFLRWDHLRVISSYISPKPVKPLMLQSDDKHPKILYWYYTV